MKPTRSRIYHNMAIMLEAGLPIIRALRVSQDSARGRLRRSFRKVLSGIEDGSTLTEAMARPGQVFGPLEVRLVECGELTGRMPQAFASLAGWYGFRDRMRRVIGSGLALPALVFFVAGLVVPATGVITGKLSLAGYPLAVLAFWAGLAGPIVLIYLLIRLGRLGGPTRWLTDWAALHVPIVGKAAEQLALGRFCLAFEAFYSSGILIDRSITTAAGVCGNQVMTGRLSRAAEAVKDGRPAWEGFPRSLPREFREVWAVGEESGSLGESVQRLGQMAAESAEWRFGELARWLPRIIYFLVMMRMAMAVLGGYSGLSSMLSIQ